MHPAHFYIAYDGPALQTHLMDVRDLAPALLALSGLLERANEVLNQDRAKIKVQVRGSFKTGSFGIDIEVVQSLGQWITGLLNTPGVTGTLNLVGLLGLAKIGGTGVIGLVRKLRGRDLQVTKLNEDGSAEVVIDGEHLVIEEEVIRLVRDHQIRQCLEDMIARPLAKDGIDTFAVVEQDRKQVIVEIKEQEANYFIAPLPTALDELVSEYDARVQIVGLTFVEGNKWRFSDGHSSFLAGIEDADFRERVAKRQEQFAQGDVLNVRMRQRQYMVNDKLRMEYDVLEVRSHHKQPPVEQIDWIKGNQDT